MHKLAKTGSLIAALALVLTGCSSSTETEEGGVANDGCTQVIVATSSEKVNLMEDLGNQFKDSAEHGALDGCATVTPVNIASGQGSELLIEDSKEWALDGVPAPTVWSPASTVWTERVASIAGASVVPDAKSFTKTPMVLGIPETMAKALGWPSKEISLKEIESIIEAPDGWGSVGKPVWGSFKIAKTNPNTSTAGLSMILMQSYAASGKTADLTAADIEASADFSKNFESGAIHYGDTTGKVLQNLADKTAGGESSYVNAIALEETSLYNYNIGNPDSHTVQPGEVLTPPADKLIAVYPEEGSMMSDNPAVVLGAKWVTPEQKTASEAFVKFLHTKEAQNTLPKYGFRPLDDTVDVSKSLNSDVGIDASKPMTVLPRPTADVVSAAIDQWSQIRKPSAVLQLIDISGSMDESMGDGKGTLLSYAIESANGSLGSVRPTDEIGVWSFTTGMKSSIDGKDSNIVAEVRPFGELGADKESLQTSISDLAFASKGGTPLYDSIDQAYEYMKKKADTGRINAIVVLSDGADTDSQISVNSLIQKIQKDAGEGGNNKQVKIFAIGFGEGADMDALEKIAKASGGQVFDATDPDKLEAVFQSVMNNF